MSDNNQAVTPQNTVGVAPGWYPDAADPHFVRYWDGHQWTGFMQPVLPTPTPVAVVNMPRQKINHVLHLLLSVLTFGLWIPVWIILALAKSGGPR